MVKKTLRRTKYLDAEAAKISQLWLCLSHRKGHGVLIGSFSLDWPLEECLDRKETRLLSLFRDGGLEALMVDKAKREGGDMFTLQEVAVQ